MILSNFAFSILCVEQMNVIETPFMSVFTIVDSCKIKYYRMMCKTI